MRRNEIQKASSDEGETMMSARGIQSSTQVRFTVLRSITRTQRTFSVSRGFEARRTGVALLEVVVALSILLVAISVVGMTFRNGAYNVERAEKITRADMLTERLIAEIETGILGVGQGEQIGYFGGESMPNMAWKVVVNPDEQIPSLLRISITIFEGDPEGGDEEKRAIATTHVLRAVPQGLDFKRDFGFTDEQITQLTDSIPGGEQVLDPTNFDPKSLASLDLDMLIELLPQIIQAFGANFGAGDLQQLMDAANRGDISELQRLGEQAVQQQTQQQQGDQPPSEQPAMGGRRGGQGAPGDGGGRRDGPSGDFGGRRGGGDDVGGRRGGDGGGRRGGDGGGRRDDGTGFDRDTRGGGRRGGGRG